MLPILFSIGSISISSLGVFLVIGFFYAIFLVWRLSRAWDFNEEKVLDVALFTAIGAFLISRLYFVIQFWSYFSYDVSRIFLIFKYPGFSFWGAFLGGWLALYFIVRKFKLAFATVVDIASVGFLGILIFGNIGCFLGGCGVGISYNGLLAVNMAGSVGKRFPVQIIEGIIFIILLSKIWPKATHFHAPGSIASTVLIYIGIIKFFTEFLRAGSISGQFFSIILLALGITMHYKFSRKNILTDIKSGLHLFSQLLTDKNVRKAVLQNTFKSWYNYTQSSLRETKISLKWRLRNFGKVLRRANVKSHPKNY